ncbi:hypothetical protein F3J14_11910 [Burkholderia sp. Tr-862]|uniref:hypothetical protein n=1 Tax=Burkholderia sp. Tr-862 TaxID=2608331 RepID=UPI00141A2703|nr:hypothetical protein [Burkholderia sp. Tr-862]NIF41576.1 hypothetical protein [Burkholderia sp. Tr-862]
MSAPFQGERIFDQHEIDAAHESDDGTAAGAGIRQWPASMATVTIDKHPAIANDWLRRAVDGIRVMHLYDDERRRIAKQIF